MKTLTEKYNGVLRGRYTKSQFLRDAKLSHPNLITNFNGYEDAVIILQNRGLIAEITEPINEEVEKYKEEKTPKHQYISNTDDMFPLEVVERGIDVELEEKGFNTVSIDFTLDDYRKAKDKALKNLQKNSSYYTDRLSSKKSSKKRSDLMTPFSKNNTVDKVNGMSKQKLKEGIKKLIINILNEDGKLK